MTVSDVSGLCVVAAIVIYVCAATFACRQDESLSPSDEGEAIAKVAPDKSIVDSELVVEIWHNNNNCENDNQCSSSSSAKPTEEENMADQDIETGMDKIVLEREASTHSCTSILQIHDGSVDGGGERFMCSICLDSFEEGDVVARSSNSRCAHVFHKDCIVGWLATRNECPMCRQIFLIVPPTPTLPLPNT